MSRSIRIHRGGIKSANAFSSDQVAAARVELPCQLTLCGAVTRGRRTRSPLSILTRVVKFCLRRGRHIGPASVSQWRIGLVNSDVPLQLANKRSIALIGGQLQGEIGCV